MPVDIDEQLAMRGISQRPYLIFDVYLHGLRADEKSPPREAMDERKPPMHVVDVARSTEDQSLCGESPPSVLAGRNREAISCNNSKHQERPAEERKDRGEEKYAGCEFGGNEKEYAGDEMVRGYNQGAINAEGNEGDFNNDAAADDASVVSALTCQFSEREITHASHPPIRPSASDLIVELDGFLSVPGMYCVGITECREGGSKPVLMDLSDSVVSMTVAIKPGAWRWIRDLSVDSRGVHSATINIGDVDEDEYAEVDLRSSMIVSVHQKSKSNLVSASMLGFVVLTMTAVLASPQIEPNVHLVERSFSSERYAIDSIDGSEKRIKVEGKMKLCLRIDIRQGDNL